MAGKLADLLFEVGSSQSKASEWLEAMYWLEKAHDILCGQSVEALSNDVRELKISIMHSLVKASMNLEGADNRAKAWNVIHEMDKLCGERLAVLLLKLDLYADKKAGNPSEHCDLLQQIVRTVHMTETNVKTVLYHVHKLRAQSAQMAHTVLIALISGRLLNLGEPEWLEKALITVIWNYTTSFPFSEDLTSLTELLDTIMDGRCKPLSPFAAHAAHTVCDYQDEIGAR